jgi:dTDP-4-amino-4,6-dideoxygalactose transaminase
MERLKIAGIPTAIYYPKPLHLQDAFSYLGYEKGSMPESERAADNIFSLPMHPYLTEEDQVKIVKPIISYIERDKDKDDIKHLKLIQKEI